MHFTGNQNNKTTNNTTSSSGQSKFIFSIPIDTNESITSVGISLSSQCEKEDSFPSFCYNSNNTPIQYPYEIADGKWTSNEHIKFLECLLLYGKNRKKLCKHLKHKTFAQIQNHFIKFSNKIKREIYLDKMSRIKHILIKNFKPYHLSKPFLNFFSQKHENNTLIKIMNLIFKNEELYFYWNYITDTDSNTNTNCNSNNNTYINSDNYNHNTTENLSEIIFEKDEYDNKAYWVDITNKNTKNFFKEKIFSIMKNKSKMIKKFYLDLMRKKAEEKRRNAIEGERKFVFKFNTLEDNTNDVYKNKKPDFSITLNSLSNSLYKNTTEDTGTEQKLLHYQRQREFNDNEVINNRNDNYTYIDHHEEPFMFFNEENDIGYTNSLQFGSDDLWLHEGNKALDPKIEDLIFNDNNKNNNNNEEENNEDPYFNSNTNNYYN